MKLRQASSSALAPSKRFYIAAILCLVFCCSSLMNSSIFVSASNPGTASYNPNIYDSKDPKAPTKGTGSSAGAVSSSNAPVESKDKPAAGEGIKCGDNSGYVNVNGMNVAQQVVDTEGQDLSEIVRKEIEKHAPECNCQPCVCTTTTEKAVPVVTIPVPKCPCTIPVPKTTSVCSTSHCFPEDIQRILNGLQITACVPPQHTPCDCGGALTCLV